MKQRDIFDSINESCKDFLLYGDNKSLAYKGDSLEILKYIPDRSISLILTDPPYHTTKKSNIYGDTFFREDKDYLDWVSCYAKEWRRIIKPNGSVYCFCSSSMAAKLEAVFAKEFNILSHIVWTKPNLPGFDGWKQKMKKASMRQWYAHSERIIFMEPAVEGNLNRSSFGAFLKKMRKKANISSHKLTEIIGAYGKVNHGGAVSNWEAGRNVPSVEQYEKICSAIISTGLISEMPEYRDVVRPFNVTKDVEFTDIWTFPNIKPYKGKHPAEKPITLLEHIITSSTYSDDIVLDCFAGSGSTAVAALKNGRYSVLIEIDDKWNDHILSLLGKLAKTKLEDYPNNYTESLLD